jgi:hypothetical protein
MPLTGTRCLTEISDFLFSRRNLSAIIDSRLARVWIAR